MVGDGSIGVQHGLDVVMLDSSDRRRQGGYIHDIQDGYIMCRSANKV